MNKNLSLLALVVSAFILSSCNDDVEKTKSQTIILAGKIQNYTDSLKPHISINRLGFRQERINPKIDAEGNFGFEFESMVPLDAWFVSNPFFLLVAHPGDSIYLNIIPKDTVIFSGDRKVENTVVFDFLAKWLTIRDSFGDTYGSISSLDQEGFIAKMDSINSKIKPFVEYFLKENKIDDPYLNSWISTYATSYYYDNLNYYVFQTRSKEVNKIQKILMSRLPLEHRDLNNANNMSSFINFFNVSIIIRGLLDDGLELTDSAIVKRIIEFDMDPLTRQLMLTENIGQSLAKLDIEKFESYANVIDSLITEPFLITPLKLKYKEALADLEKAKNLSAPLIISNDFNSIDLLDSIITANKGNVIFLDLWATWCAPCISEFKNSGPFKDALAGEPITYIYVCAQSEKSLLWKAMVQKYHLAGVNIYLNKAQYTDFDAKFDIAGFPTYMIYDKEGELVEKGFSWRPSNPGTLTRIKTLLQ